MGMGFGFLIGVQLARGLGAEGYGVYGLAMSIIALLTIPTEFGLPNLLTREVAAAHAHGDAGRLHAVVRWATRSVLGLSVIVSIVAIGWLLGTGRGLTTTIGLTVLAGMAMVPLVALGKLKGATLRGMQHLVKGQLPDGLVRPMAYSALLFLVPLWLMPLTPAIAMLAGTAAAAIAYLVATRLLRSDIMADPGFRGAGLDTRAWWGSALPMAMTEGVRGLQGHATIIVMGAIAAEAMVGVFRVALSVSTFVALPITLFMIVGSPVVSRLNAENDKRRLQRLAGWLALGMSIGSLLLALPFFVVGDWLLSSVFGREFGAGNLPLAILCVGVVVYAALGPSAILLNMTHHEQRVTKAFMVSVMVVVSTAIPLVKLYGAIGAALADVAGMLVGAIVMWRDASRLLDIDCSVWSLLRAR
ncbi:MAG: hypothetical protein EPO30_01720 [Lysobacteraceae bacterium]|nr:MAG: hypothetical protein EPO30_01720 [Xanthomonadaceae bacterium]